MKTWQEIQNDPVGTVYHDSLHDGLRFRVIRGPSHLCAYVGVPSDHPLAGHSTDDLPVNCHGGLTFSGEGKKDSSWPQGRFWYGWDYGHSGDQSTDGLGPGGKAWLPEEVVADAWEALWDFQALTRLAEAIWFKKGKNA